MKKIAKKAIAVCLAAAAVPVSVPIGASAAEISFAEILGINEPFQTLSAGCDYDGGNELSYSWRFSDSRDGEYADTGVTGKSFYVEKQYESKWIKLIISDGETSCETIPEKIDDAWGKQTAVDNVNTKFDVVNKTSPRENIFTVGGEDYILLDTTENDSSKFLVLKDKTVGTRGYASTRVNTFHDMAAFLNNKKTVETSTGTLWKEPFPTTSTTDYTQSGYIGNNEYTQLANVILENINENHVWRIEERNYRRPEGERVIRAGIVLPALTEVKKYCDKIGLYDANGFWYRTPSVSSTGGAFSASAIEENIGKAVESNYDAKLGLRPMFYLDKSFFADAKIPVFNLGDEVKKSIKATYKKSELSGVYSEEELENIFGYSDSPKINKIRLTDENNNPIGDIKNVSRFNVTVSLTNGDNNIKTGIYAAVYGGDGRLKAIGHDELLLQRGKQGVAGMLVVNTAPSSDDELRVFVWDKNQMPISEKYMHSNGFSAALSGIYETMQKISVVINGNPYAEYACEWYISDSKDGEYSKIEGENKTDLEVKSEYSEKWIKAEVTNDNGNSYTTEAKKIGARWGRTSNIYLEGRSAPNDDDIFAINGQTFILLDSFESDESKYLVMTEEPVVKHVYSNGGQRPDTIMAWLNGTEFKTAGYLPEAVHRHVNTKARWKTEPYAYYNNDGKNTVENYTVGGISLPAISEAKKYIDKVTIYKESGWWTRTPYARDDGGDGNCVMASSNTNNGTFYPMNTMSGESFGIRPIFLLDKSFFANERIDINRIGKNVRAAIINNYKKSELKAYNAEEREIITNTGNITAKLENLMDSSAGVIPIEINADTDKTHTYTFELKADGKTVSEQNLVINDGKTEETVELDGLFETNIPIKVKNAPNGTVSWHISDSADGEYTVVGEGMSFTSAQNHGGKYIKAVVLSGGDEYESEPVRLKDSWRGKKQGPANEGEEINAEATAMIKSIAVGDDIYSETPKENIFSIDDDDFILLDTTEDANSHFLVMRKKVIGSRTIAKNGQIPADIMCWLNNKKNIEVVTNGSSEYIEGCGDYTGSGYLSGADGFEALPERIVGGINFDAYWKQEPKMWGGNVERVYRAGISIPAATELERYYSKFGWRDSGAQYTWTRTGQSNSGDGETMLSYNTDWAMGTLYPNCASKSSYGIRPIFYLKESFFLDNVVSLDGVGSAVREAITSQYSAYELLKAGYNSDEVAKYCSVTGGFDGKLYNFSTNGLANGIYDMELIVRLDGREISHNSKRVCYMPEYKREFMDFYSAKGYCDSLSTDWAYDYAIKSGVRMMRIGKEWHSIEKQKGVYDFSDLDKTVEKLTSDGVEIVMLMAYGNTLYSDNIKTGPANKEAIDAFAKCLAAMAERYPQIKYFEVYNEPNLTGFWQPAENHRDYTYLLQVSDREVRKVRQDAKIAGGVLADGGAGWLSNMLSKNAYPYMDVLSFHPYIYWYKNRVDTIYNSKLAGFTNLPLKYGGFKESIITEVGWPSYNENDKHGCNEETQALETTKQYIFAEMSGINKIMAYNFVNSGRNPDYNEDNFGIITKDGIAKPAYLANAIMRNKLAGAVPCGEITFENDTGISHGYLYNKSGKPILVLWKDFQRGENAANVKGRVNLSGESVRVYDMSGNLTEKNTDTVNLGSTIVYVEGLSDKWYKKALAESYQKIISAKLSAIGQSGYEAYFDNVKADIAALGDEMSETAAKAVFDKHFEIADRILAVDSLGDNTLSALLDVVYESGVFIANYYMCTINGHSVVTAEAGINSLAAKIKQKEDTAIGGYLPRSNAILEIAKNQLDFAKRTAAISESNPIKAGFTESRNALSEKLVKLGEAMCEKETLTCDDIVVFAPTEEVNLTEGKQGEAIFSVYNYDDKDLSGAILTVTDASGNVLAEGNVSVAAGESMQLPLTMTIADKSVLSGGYGYAYLKLNGKTMVKISVKLIVK